MGEALISRAGGGGEAEAIIPITPGYHTMLITLRDYENKAMPNFTINCKDGSSWYNYTTNDKGQAMFTTNSGSANFTIFNNLGARYLDFNTSYMNIDSPIGQTSRHDIVINKTTGNLHITTSGNYRFLIEQPNLKCILCGGGGGAGGARETSDYTHMGGYGGNGYITNVNGGYSSNVNYYITIGTGGTGGRGDGMWNYSLGEDGGAGGTTTFFNNSAYGGSGGTGGNRYRDGNNGAGGSGLDSYGKGGTPIGSGDSRGGSGTAGVVRFIFN